MILNVSAVLMTNSFMLADQIFLERIQSTTQNQLKWIFLNMVRSVYSRMECEGLRFIKRKQYILFKVKYLINVSKFNYSKIIKIRTGDHRLPVETGR